MALTYINLSGFQRGLPSDELGFNVAKFDLEVEPEVNEWLPGKTGEARGKAVATVPGGKLTFEGEIFDLSVGIFIGNFITTFTPVNSMTYFGRAGGFYLDKGHISLSREGWKTVSAEFTSKALVS